MCSLASTQLLSLGDREENPEATGQREGGTRIRLPTIQAIE